MLHPELLRFIKNSEKMITPAEVSTLFQRAEMLRKLPLKLQKFILDKASDKNAFIGFVVEPYAFFLAYEIVDVEKANRLLPPGYELIPCAMFDETEPRYCAIVGVFNVHTSVFWGNRVELYLIAENKRTGMMSWIIDDYESNTISYDPGRGFSGPSTRHAVVTTAYTGDLVIDVQGRESTNHIALTAQLKAGKLSPLTQRLWVEGNLSVDYGGELEETGTEPFGLIFDPGEMAQALNVPLEAVAIEQNSFGEGMLAKRPFEAACFPYAQHFLTTSFPKESQIQNEADLHQAIQQFNRQHLTPAPTSKS